MSSPSADRNASSSRTEQVPDEPATRLPGPDEGGTGHESETMATLSGPAPTATGPDVPLALQNHPRYRVLEPLGSGGMGAVYRAEHRLMRRPVALKVINPALTANGAAVERFRREVIAAARLTHPNIVTAHDAEHAGDLHFLAMELVEGMSLNELLGRRGRLSVADACDYARQAALGLQHAFEQGMVHRDIKPHNLMLTPQGQIKILDFGLARFVSDTNRGGALTQAGMAMGTADYMAPEQARDSRTADIRADIYSLGCTLYSFLTGQLPFPEGDAIQKLMAHVREKPRPVAELRPEVPPALCAVVERMMAKDPAQRYQTPAEVATALAPFTRPVAVPAGSQTQVAAVPAASPKGKPAAVPQRGPAARPIGAPAAPTRRRGPWVAVALALLFTVVVAGVAIAVALSRLGSGGGAGSAAAGPEGSKTTSSTDVDQTTSRVPRPQQGIGRAPDLSAAQPLARYDFRNSRNGWPEVLNRNGVSRGWARGAYFIRSARHDDHYESLGDHFSNFACEVVGRIRGQAAPAWGLALFHGPREDSRVGLWVTLNHRGLHIIPFGTGANEPNSGRPVLVPDPAVESLDRFNRLLVVVRDARLRAYVNGVAAGDPVAVPAGLEPATVALAGRFGPRGGEVEFERLTIWSAADIPAP